MSLQKFDKERFKKSSFIFLSFFVVFLQFLAMFNPVSVRAQAVTVVGDVPSQVVEIKKTIGATLLSAAMGGLMTAFSYFMRRLAYDSAMYISSGGKGQGALAFKDGFGAYMNKTALDTAATAIEEIGKPFGLNLCQTPNLNLQVWLQIGIGSLYLDMEGAGNGPKPSCTFQELSGSWNLDAMESKYKNSLDNTFNNAIRVENSDFGLAYGAMAKVDRNVVKMTDAANSDRAEGGGFKALTDIVTGKIKTPANIIKEESNAVTNNGQAQMTATQVAGVYGSGMLQVFPQAMSVFLNTFLANGMKQAQQALTGIDPLEVLGLRDDGTIGDVGGSAQFDSTGFQSSRKQAQVMLSELINIKFSNSRGYSILDEFVSCEQSSNVLPGLDNCVIDQDFKKALDVVQMGTPLTIAEAMSKGYLKGDWPLISPRRVSDNSSKDCRTKGYCYSNLQKLRRNRILPLGFEIAASKADPDDPYKKWTLKQVVLGFDNCAFKQDANGQFVTSTVDGSKIVIPDPEGHPYCRLIDPNWVLKAPSSICQAKGYGPTLLDTQSGARAEYCADLRTCLFENADGSCDENNYGYCTKEKNIWRFNTKDCSEQYSTCTGYTDSAGKNNYYLARTLDVGLCSIENVGCLAYSLEKKNGNWVDSLNNNFDNTDKLAGRNPTLYFNAKIKNYTCDSSNDGCSEFYLGSLSRDATNDYANKYSDIDLRYFKKAPAYLGCYDLNTSTPQIDWPETSVEINSLKPVEACNNYSQVCIKDEIGCDSYTPQTFYSPVNVPGIIGNKSCPKECNGYNTFKQETTGLTLAEFPLYFIPSRATSCSAEYNGCDEFTNIDMASKGGESLEYFYAIKYCEKPTADNQSTFYSWEGSKTNGYVLKVHKLRPVNQTDYNYFLSKPSLDIGGELLDKVFPVGSPMYNSDIITSLNQNYKMCNAEAYNKTANGFPENTAGSASADCRALYNQEGKIFYRLLANTIQVSELCHPLRKTLPDYWIDESLISTSTCVDRKGKWQADKCLRCLSGGFYDADKDSCIYWTTGETGSCPDSAKGCREYTGNQGRNIEIIYYSNFDPVTSADNTIQDILNGWGPAGRVSWSTEALKVGEHSLQINGGGVANLEVTSSTFAKNSWYEISFWGRGNGAQVEIYFGQSDPRSYVLVEKGVFTYDQAKKMNTKIPFGVEWRKYELGPVQFTGEAEVATFLAFANSEVNKFYFIDNLEIRRLTNTYYLLKNSWRTPDGFDAPIACDSVQADPYPGEALGCAEYLQESNSTLVYTTGFEKLCREKAVGCQPVFDTYNTGERGITAYNVWCKGIIRANVCSLKIFSSDGYETEYKCNVEANADGCFLDKIAIEDGMDLNQALSTYGEIVTSTIIIPADTTSTEPLYLTVHNKYSCDKVKKGCQVLGAETKNISSNDGNAFSYTETAYLNDPAKYISGDGIEGTLCRADLVGCESFGTSAGLSFFKNPTKTGNSYCEYKNQDSSGGSLFGWYKKDVGRCYTGATALDLLCNSSADCGEGNTCNKIGEVPCYEDYAQAGGENGIWSNGSAQYKGLVGICPSDQNNCREIIDPVDKTADYPLGQPYFVIYDQNITANLDDCNSNNVSQREGCVLFRKADQPNLLYNAVETYKASLLNNNNLVVPVFAGQKDSNIVLKVKRDRECGEWLSCRGYMPIPDTQNPNQERNGCFALQLCEKGNNYNCIKEADHSLEFGKILDYNTYVTRNVSWSGSREYTGYSFFNSLPLADLNFITVSSSVKEKIALGFVDRKISNICISSSNDGDLCGRGICYNKECVVPFSGSFGQNFYNLEKAGRKNTFAGLLEYNSCRVYPNEKSPFSDQAKMIVKSWFAGKPLDYRDQKYQQAKLCEQGEDCECNYAKVEYGQNGVSSLDRYYELGSDNKDLRLGGVCQSGEKEGLSCSVDLDCGDATSGNICLRKQKQVTYVGWNGYCLERDLSRRINGRTDNSPEAFACLTWYPLDYVPALFDIYYNDPNKGYVPPNEPGNPGKLYCTEMLGVKNLTYDSGLWCESPESVLDINEDLNSNLFTVSGGLCKTYYNARYHPEGLLAPLYPSNPVDVNFSLVQERFWSYLDSLNPNHGFKWEEKRKNFMDFERKSLYHYLSRIDNPYIPAYQDSILGNGPLWNFAPYNNTSPEINSKLREMQSLSSMWMLKGAGGLTLSPIWSDTEVPDANVEKTYHLKTGATSNSSKLSEYSDGEDTGIISNLPAESEKFLNKKMIYAVSFIPMWYGENGDNDTPAGDYAPVLGYPMTIYLDKNYPNSGEKPENLEMLRNGSASCKFCKYWIMKTDRSATNVVSEGYQLQWFIRDPVSGDSDDPVAGIFTDYASADGYLSDPLGTGANNKEKVRCKQSKVDPDNKNGFLAVEVLFDKDTGDFQGYRSRSCLRTANNSDFGYSVAVVFTLKPICTEAALVYDDSAGKINTNKAYTDNIWLESVDVNLGQYSGEKNKVSAPFGSVSFNDFSNLANLNKDPWYYIYPSPGQKEINAGLAVNCASSFGLSSKMKGECPKATDNPIEWGGFSFGSQNKGLSTNVDLVKYLFAKVYKMVKYNSGQRTWSEIVEQDLDSKFESADLAGVAPSIYAVKDCAGDTCKLKLDGKNNFNINGVAGETQESLNGPSDNLFGKGNRFVSLSFFAWADHNQMPLRKIMVDWREKENDNSSVSGNTMGYYTNYKPYCGSEGVAKECSTLVGDKGITCNNNFDCPVIGYGGLSIQTTCESATAHFGNISGRTCSDSSVQRFFNYTCDFVSGSINNIETVLEIGARTDIDGQAWYNFLLNKGLKADSQVCVYQPAVQVMDNWEWCIDGSSLGTGLFGEENCSNQSKFVEFNNIIVVAP